MSPNPIFFSLLLFFSFSTFYGQVDESKNFILLFSDSVIYGRIIEYEKPLLKPAMVVVDGQKFLPRMVKFYQNETGFYGNAQFANSSSSPQFFERIRKGKINLYEREYVTYSNGGYNPSSGGFSPGFSNKNIVNYYNKGFELLKKPTYANLMVDLADNPESMVFVNKVKRNNTTKAILYGVGIPSLAIGAGAFISGFKKAGPNGKNPNEGIGIGGMVVGGVSLWAAYFVNLEKPKLLRKAIDAYNK